LGVDPLRVKNASEAQIRAEGGGVNTSLPYIGLDELALRASDAVADRTLVLHVLVNLSFGMPGKLGREWLSSHGAIDAASPREMTLLSIDSPLDSKAQNRARWNIEALWAAAWAGGLVDELLPTQRIGDELASRLPNLQVLEAPDDFRKRFTLRVLEDIYPKLDLFYRAHWYVRECQLTGKESAPFNFGIVQLRRQLLEWVAHEESEWDHVELST